jgi:hypothetical protein
VTFIGFIGLRIDTVVGFCEHGKEPLGIIKRREFRE